jgi:hypothetical protein
MKSDARYFDITFQGVEYEVEVIKQGKDTTVFVQYVHSDEDIEDNILSKLTKYLIGEGFIEYEQD